MVLNNQIIELLKERSGLSFDKAKDFELLGDSINKKTGRSIGVTTIKRLLGYISDERKTNEYTLNTIGIYLGFKSWEDMCSTIRIDSDWGGNDETVYVGDLPIGSEVFVKYLNRTVRFETVLMDNTHALKVVESVNSSLRTGDILIIDHLKKGEKLEAKTVYRGNDIGNYRTNGELLEVTVKDNNQGC